MVHSWLGHAGGIFATRQSFMLRVCRAVRSVYVMGQRDHQVQFVHIAAALAVARDTATNTAQSMRTQWLARASAIASTCVATLLEFPANTLSQRR